MTERLEEIHEQLSKTEAEIRESHRKQVLVKKENSLKIKVPVLTCTVCRTCYTLIIQFASQGRLLFALSCITSADFLFKKRGWSQKDGLVPAFN